MRFTGIRKKVLFLFIVVPLFAILPGGAFSVKAQTTGIGDEKVFVHTNKPVYVAGEMLRYRIFTFNKKSNLTYHFSEINFFVLK